MIQKISKTTIEAYNQVNTELYHSEKYTLFNDKKIFKESRGSITIHWNQLEKGSQTREELFKREKDYSLIGDIDNTIANEEYNYYFGEIFLSGKFDKAIKLLKKDKSNKKATIHLMEEPTPRNKRIPPCMSYIWFRINNNKLIMNCHMRANNAFRILLINLDINQLIHSKAAAELAIEIGEYNHFVDSIHLYTKELDSVSKYLDSQNLFNE